MVKQPRYVKVKSSLRFVVDWAIPDAEGIVKWDDLVAYFQDRIKVKGKAGVLGDDVKVTREKAKLIVTSEIEMSKRYIKYLTKKFLQCVRGGSAGGAPRLTHAAQEVRGHRIFQAGRVPRGEFVRGGVRGGTEGLTLSSGQGLLRHQVPPGNEEERREGSRKR